MEYQDFYEILKKGKTITTSFMPECNAFKGSVKDDAELARDIIAMANNGNIASYIIIGVSDDGQLITSVENENLTDDNLQAFCMGNIFPPPAVNLSRLDLTDGDTETNQEVKSVIVIQVGPQPHQCFRFNRDFIYMNDIYFFRNHEVWVRRNATSSLATPEEIKRLLEGQSVVFLPQPEISYEEFLEHTYSQITQERFLILVFEDLNRLAKKEGGKMYHDKDPFLKEDLSISHYMIIFVNGNPLILRVIVTDSCTQKGEILEYNRKLISFHNGILLISRSTVQPEALENCALKLKEPWGWFCAGDAKENDQAKERGFKIPLPATVWKKIGEPVPWNMVFSNIYSYASLKNAWEAMVNALSNDETIKKVVEENSPKTLAKMVLWMKEGCPTETTKYFRPKMILENEIWDPEKYGNVILIKHTEYCQAVNALLKKMDDAYAESFLEGE